MYEGIIGVTYKPPSDVSFADAHHLHQLEIYERERAISQSTRDGEDDQPSIGSTNHTKSKNDSTSDHDVEPASIPDAIIESDNSSLKSSKQSEEFTFDFDLLNAFWTGSAYYPMDCTSHLTGHAQHDDHEFYR